MEQLSKMGPAFQVDVPSGTGVALLGSLAVMELLILLYWIEVQIFVILPALLGVGGVTAFIGRSALRQKAVSRLQ